MTGVTEMLAWVPSQKGSSDLAKYEEAVMLTIIRPERWPFSGKNKPPPA